MNTISIPFTQYHLPNGRRTQESFTGAPASLKPKVDEILAQGLNFTAEILRNGYISLCIANDAKGEDYDCRVVPNGLEVPKAIESMIEKFNLVEYAEWLKADEDAQNEQESITYG